VRGCSSHRPVRTMPCSGFWSLGMVQLLILGCDFPDPLSRVSNVREVGKKSPATAGLFPIVQVPEPGPDGVSVDPLGEELGPTVLPDGFMLVLDRSPSRRCFLWSLRCC
jgi:hypothetical protein